MSRDNQMLPLGQPGNAWAVNDRQVDLCRQRRAPRPMPLVAEPQHLVVDAARAALLIIDMQNDFCHANGWLARLGVDTRPLNDPVAPLQRLLPELRQAGIKVFWVNWGNRADLFNISPSLLHVYKPDGRATGLGDPLPGMDSRVLERESWGAEIVAGLEPAPQDIQIAKYRMSGFWDNELDSILRNLDLQTLFFAGVNLDQCVMATLQDASFLGYDCILLADCAATSSPPFCIEASLYNIRQCYGFVSQATSLLSALRELPA